MGETTNVEQGKATSGSGQKPQPQEKQTSVDGSGTTSTQTFTESEEYKKAVSDRVTELGRKYGDLTKREQTLEAREQVLREAEERHQQEQESKEMAELEEATQDEPEVKPKLLDIKKKLAERHKDIARREAELKTNEAKYAEKFKSADEAEFEVTVFEIANKNEVDASVLKDKAERLKLRDEASISEIASVMAKKTESGEHDSGKTMGVSPDLSTPEAKLREGFRRLKK